MAGLTTTNPRVPRQHGGRRRSARRRRRFEARRSRTQACLASTRHGELSRRGRTRGDGRSARRRRAPRRRRTDLDGAGVLEREGGGKDVPEDRELTLVAFMWSARSEEVDGGRISPGKPSESKKGTAMASAARGFRGRFLLR